MILPALEKQRKITNDLLDLKLKTGLNYPDNTLFEVAQALGIDVFDLELAKFPQVNGVIQYPNGNKSKPSIFINKNLSPQGRTFTLAHELGHYILHHGHNKLFIDEFDYTKKDKTANLDEIDANYFAVNLLVPTERFRRLRRITSDIEPLAKYFGVSNVVIETKLEWIHKNTV